MTPRQIAAGAALCAGVGLVAWWMVRAPTNGPGPALVVVYQPGTTTVRADLRRAAALWLGTAGDSDRKRLMEALARVDEHLERSKNPLVEDLDDVSLQDEARAAHSEFGPAWTAVTALSRIGDVQGACDERTCVKLAASCPPGGDCEPLRSALRNKRGRLALWPLAGGATLSCPGKLPDTTQMAAARLRARGADKTSSIAWAFTQISVAGDDVRGRAASLLASLQSFSAVTPPPWLVALAQDPGPHEYPWLDKLGAGFVVPKLSRWSEHEQFVREIREVVGDLGCYVDLFAPP